MVELETEQWERKREDGEKGGDWEGREMWERKGRTGE